MILAKFWAAAKTISVISGGAALILFGLAIPVSAQDPLNQVGSPTFSTAWPVELGVVNLGNGNLHIAISLASFPERGAVPFSAALVYDSRMWQVVFGSSASWQPTNAGTQMGGWRFLATGHTGLVVEGPRSNFYCGKVPNRSLGGFYSSNFVWTQPDGVQRAFPLTIEVAAIGNPCRVESVTSGTAYANDSSGYYISVTNTNVAVIYAPDGTQVYPKLQDTNGNSFSVDTNGNVIDTLGRTPVTATTNCNGNSSQICYTILNSQGNSSTVVTVTTESIPVSTAFGVTGETEYANNVTVIKSIALPDGTSYQFSYDSGSTSGHYGELTGITLPTGGSINYGYTKFTDADSQVNEWMSTYLMGGGTWTFTPTVTGSCPSGYSGCQQVTVKKPSSDNVVYTFGLNGGAWENEVQYYNRGIATANLLKTSTMTWTTTPSNVQQLSTTTTLPVPGGANISRTTQYLYASTQKPLITQVSDWKYWSGTMPTNPDAIKKITYLTGYPNNNISRPTQVTVTDGSGNPVSQTSITYDSTLVQGPSATPVAQHDDTNYGTGYTTRGNATLTQTCAVFAGSSCSTYVTSTLTYDTTGQVVKVQDSGGNSTALSYADHFYTDNGATPPQSYAPTIVTNAYLTSVTPALGSAITFGYYFNSGKRAFSKDQNGADTYEHFLDAGNRDRLTNIYFPLTYLASASGNYRGWELFSYAALAQGTQVDTYGSIASTSASTGCTSCAHSEAVSDNLKRPLDDYLVSDPDGQTTASVAYDSNGRMETAIYPFRTSAGGQDTTVYDGVDRAITVTHLDGEITATSYGSAVSGTGVNLSQLCTTATYGRGYPVLTSDEAGKRRELWTDGFGRTIEIDEPDSTGKLTADTCYVYDLNNNLTQVVSATGQTRTYTYDAMSRLTSVATPETNLGGTQYQITFSYLSGGSACSGDPSAVCQRLDQGRTITTSYKYDALNRVTQVSYSPAATPAITYCYDGNNTACIAGGFSSSNPAGRRTAMEDGSGSTGWNYDATGRVVTETRTIAGVTKTISYSYNLDGSIAAITYPSGHTVSYTVGNAGRAISAADTSSGNQYAAVASYTPMGAVSSVIYGQATNFTGTVEQRNYNNRLETTSIQASSSNGVAMNLTYCFNPFTFSSGCSGADTNNNGSVTGITNGADSGESQTITYDNLNRILTTVTNATSGSDCWGQSFSGGIDAVANLTAFSVTQCTAGSLGVGSDGKNHLTATNFSYDNSGNMLNDGQYTYTYDAENRITSANGVNYTYDGNGLRVEKSNGTIYWRSIGGDTLAESDLQGNMKNEYVFFGGRRIAQRTSTAVYYYYSDGLGTVHTITDATGHACYDATFTPYGQEMVNPNIPDTCSSNFKFTGYEYDSETDLYYAIARYYNTRLGRFMSPDPLSGDIRDPQSLNRYAYVANDPENLVDPSGMVCNEGGSRSKLRCHGEAQTQDCIVDGVEGLNCGGLVNLLQGNFAELADANALDWSIVSTGGENSLDENSPLFDLLSDWGSFFDRAGGPVYKVLKGENDCSAFFNGAPLVQINVSQANMNPLLPGVLPTSAAAFFRSDLLETDSALANSVGAATNEGAGAAAVIAVNTNPQGAFMGGFHGQVGPFATGTPQAQTIMLLHELAHTLLLIPPDGQAAVAAGFPSSQTNTQTILDHCLNAVKAVFGGSN